MYVISSLTNRSRGRERNKIKDEKKIKVEVGNNPLSASSTEDFLSFPTIYIERESECNSCSNIV
jgi:hypothetical protein